MSQFDFDTINKYVTYSRFTVEKHPSSDIFIYGYNQRKPGYSIKWDDINIHLRGLILDSTGKIVARSFPKFFTFKEYLTKNVILLTEGKTLRLPDEEFSVYEKVDGSLSILYWIDDIPYLASQRSFLSPNAKKATEILHSKYSNTFKKLRRDVTYIFEAIYPNTRVLVNYDHNEDLILLGIIDNETGIELPLEEVGFPTAKDFTNTYKNIQDFEELSNLNIDNLEGLIIRYRSGLRIKIKFPWFNEAHYLLDRIIADNFRILETKRRLAYLLNLRQEQISAYKIWECLKSNQPLESLLMRIPEDFYSSGFEDWFEGIVNRIEVDKSRILNHSPNIGHDELWNKLKPDNHNFFDPFERVNEPMYCTPMWNLLNRIQNTFI